MLQPAADVIPSAAADASSQALLDFR